MPKLESRVVILGAAGMLGHALTEIFPKATFLDFRNSGEIGFADVTSLDNLRTRLKDLKHGDCVINASAYTDVDGAETEKGSRLSYDLSVTGPQNLAVLAVEQGFKVVHYSTAFVFDGKTGHYKESDIPNPLNNYGAHKLAGEKPILDVGGIVLRTDVLYGPNGSKSFVDAIVRQLAGNPLEVEVVNDQIGSPTFTHDLALMTDAMINRMSASGVYHAVNEGAVSRAEMARQIIKILGLRCSVREISTNEYNENKRRGVPTAVRPNDCSLELARLHDAWYKPRSWDVALADYIHRHVGTPSSMSSAQMH